MQSFLIMYPSEWKSNIDITKKNNLKIFHFNIYYIFIKLAWILYTYIVHLEQKYLHIVFCLHLSFCI